MKLIPAFFLTLITIFSLTNLIFAQQVMPPSLEQSLTEPIKYTGQLNPDKRFYDGRLPHAVGVHHYQVFRANRSNPSEPGITGWTYNHQPYLSYWNGTFYLQYLSGLIGEHTPPTRILITQSKDGISWSDPVVAFPEYILPEINDDGEIIPAGTFAVHHQRMGWYVAPNGKLLTLGFVGYCATPRRSPNAGNGIGRIVREVKSDGTFGPVYFIRYNRHVGWNEKNTNYPFYKESKDKEFLDACESLLSDKLITLQWWEEDRGKDGFFAMDPSQVPDGDTFSKKSTTAAGAGKAFNFYTRPDGVIVGLWKNQYASLSPDKGKTWTPIVKNESILTTGAKTWGQRTDDGRYVIVHNQSPTKRNRFPMTALVGDDGHTFDRIFGLRGEVPTRRYQGIHKNPGVQYFRGIIEGNGNPPGNDLWMTYSVNKEDIWITKTPTPIVGSVDNEVNENFENVNSISDLKLWSVYMPKWGPISIIKDPDLQNSYLELRDEEPYDYSFVERIFPSSSKKVIEFKFQGEKIPQGFAPEVEIQDQKGNRPVKLRIDKDWLSFDIEKVSVDPVKIDPKSWNHVLLEIDCVKGSYVVTVNGIKYPDEIKFGESTGLVERIIFRTGPYRNFIPAQVVERGIGSQSGFDLDDQPGADYKSPLIILNLDDIITRSY
ncbi:MAG TPA: hypothetical protein PLZ15_01835 [Melioribacteraceae bacterium]|nr:hypothetical protein [Melioribacteraceae bacterium]